MVIAPVTMEVFITAITTLISSVIGKKYGMTVGIQIGTIIGLFIREYIKKTPTFLPNFLRSNHMEIKQKKPDYEPNPIFIKIEEYILKNHAGQMKSMSLIFERGSLKFELPSKKMSIDDTFEGHKMVLSVHDKPKMERDSCRSISIKSRTASIDMLKTYIDKICKFSETFPNVYLVYTPVIVIRKENDICVRWDRGTKIKSTKTLKNVVLAKSVTDELDFEKFLNDEEWYLKMGIPYRRGYCLYGPPGTGKTSIIRALANQYGLDIYRLSLDNIPSDYHLDQLISEIDSEGRVYILVFEDIDRTRFFNRLNDPKQDGGAKEVSVGTFLNVLDGLTGNSGRITFMTINDETALNKCDALFRPGRIDKKIYIPFCDADQIKRLFISFFPDINVEEEKIKIHMGKISPAELIKLLYERIDSPKIALKRIYSEK